MKYSKGSAGGIHCSLLTSLSINMIYSRIIRRVIVEKRIIAPVMSSLRADATRRRRRDACTFIYPLERAFLDVATARQVGIC